MSTKRRWKYKMIVTSIFGIEFVNSGPLLGSKLLTAVHGLAIVDVD